MRELLGEIEAGPPGLDQEKDAERMSKWLRSVEDNQDKVHPIGEFVAGSFERHLAAWEEL
jgi:hypothetical protein